MGYHVHVFIPFWRAQCCKAKHLQKDHDYGGQNNKNFESSTRTGHKSQFSKLCIKLKQEVKPGLLFTMPQATNVPLVEHWFWGSKITFFIFLKVRNPIGEKCITSLPYNMTLYRIGEIEKNLECFFNTFFFVYRRIWTRRRHRRSNRRWN